jgi:superfamily I DNA/RNA helicase
MKTLSEKPEEDQDEFYLTYANSYEKIRELILSVMIEEGVYTFETMLIVYRDLLVSPNYIDYQTQFLKRYKVLLVDEYQDCSGFVDSICVAIADLMSTATFCGDPCQAIYSKTPNEVFKNLNKWNLYNIETGYRMSQTILDVSNFVRQGIVTNEHLNLTGVATTARTHEAILKHLNTPGKINLNAIDMHIPKPILFEQIITEHLDAIEDNESIVFMAYTNRDVKVINDIISRQGWEKTVDYSKADDLHGYKHMASLLYYKLLSDIITDNDKTSFAWKQISSCITASLNDHCSSSKNSNVEQFLERNTTKSLIYRAIDVISFHMISLLSAIGTGKAIPSNIFRGRLLATVNETIENYILDNPHELDLKQDNYDSKVTALFNVFVYTLTVIISPDELPRIAVGRSKQKDSARNKISSLIEEFIEAAPRIGNFNTDPMSDIITLAHEWLIHRGKAQKPEKPSNSKKTNMEHPAIEHLRKLFGTFSEHLRRGNVRYYVRDGDGAQPEHAR